ncbi:FG-GAP-like repeat-containing protein [Pontibacter sp. G13]|uniref:FG-GAP-like repeat-containing protein n=1 Tax=Pontibacter sp. G13 TaxID=3074898 RepID=UPI00288AAE87|nr:FG-GAP-like repeat-containing protein [Pontibacter sp. G13]WNJ19201.1 FG-GAP-like repeat-containing protein [Pontibacter sp. G13]
MQTFQSVACRHLLNMTLFPPNQIWLRALMLAFWAGWGCFGPFSGTAQIFSDQTNSMFSGLAPTGRSESTVAWGDFDADGYLDFAVAGEIGVNTVETRIYRFIPGTGQFLQFAGASTLPNVRNAGLAWGDYDLDGDLDLLISGETVGGSAYFTGVFKYNTFTNSFSQDLTASPAFIQVNQSAVAWGDIDNDGDLDAVISGADNSGVHLRIYRNDGGSVFQLQASLQGVSNASLALGDYDNDQDLDLLVTGTSSTGQRLTRLYRNSNGFFSDIITTLPNVHLGSVAWADYDLDGDIDILISGEGISGLVAEVYRNDGTLSGLQTFTAISAGLTGVRDGEAVWGDINADGYSDIVLTGQDGASAASAKTEVYLNNQMGGFTFLSQASTDLQDVNTGASVQLADYNSDDLLDVVLVGYNPAFSTSVARLYRNDGAFTPFVNPTAPQNLAALQTGNAIQLSWNPPAGYPTGLLNNLTYEVVIGTTSNGFDVRTPMSDINTGERRLSMRGSVEGTSLRIQGLASGTTYYWRVQAIDAKFNGSPFSAEGTFTINSTAPTTASFLDVTNSEFVTVPAGLASGSMEWVDYDVDGDMDFIMNGAASFSPFIDIRTSLYTNAGGGNFALNPSVNFPALFSADLAWGDFNMDNQPDLVMIGLDINGDESTSLHLNTGSGTFSQLTGTGLGNVASGAIGVGDYDNDGDLDILLTGNNSINQATTKLFANQYIQTGTVSFVEDAVVSADLIDVRNSAVAFGDYDKDGFPDLAISGYSTSLGLPVTRIYQNQQDGTFLELSVPIAAGVQAASLAWGDANNDGYLDLAMSGENQFSNALTRILMFDPGSSQFFQLSTAFAPLESVKNGRVSWGDYNDDGFADLLVTGETDNGPVTDLYSNLADITSVASPFNTTFVRDDSSSVKLTDMGPSNAAFGDFDGDQILDIMMSGSINSSTQLFKLFRNTSATPNASPNVPLNLAATLKGFDVELSWDAPYAPAGLDSLITGGYSYAVYIRNLAGTNIYRTPTSNLTDGFHRLVGPGRESNNTKILISGLTPGTYQWTVQAIDQDYEGSDFPNFETFLYEDPVFIDSTIALFPLISPIALIDADLAYGDYSGDGYLDLIAIGRDQVGTPVSNLYIYDPAMNTFIVDQLNSAQITDVFDGSVAWADANNDGTLDLLVTGSTQTTVETDIYLNNGGSFSASNKVSLTGVTKGFGIWLDYDQDGDEDVLFGGENGTGQGITRLMENDGNASFTEVLVGVLPGLTLSDADAGDFNQDGHVDLVLLGETSTGNANTFLYQSDKEGGFKLIADGAVPDVKEGSVEFGDFNADGWIDLAISGSNNSGNNFLGGIYRNNQSGAFVATGAPFTPIKGGTLGWGDYNNDGYPDLIAAGQDAVVPATQSVRLYEYDQLGSTFVEKSTATQGFPQVGPDGAVAWGDLNQNGKLDLAVAGSVEGLASFALMANIEPSVPTTPAAPTGLESQIDGFDVRLSWDAPANLPAAITPGLSYNIYIGSTPSGVNVQSPEARLSDGERRMVHRGIVSDTTSLLIKDLDEGTYYWSVQAIDADFEGSPFASEEIFTFEFPTFESATALVFPGNNVGLAEGHVEWADVDLDGRLDLLTFGLGDNGAETHLFQNQPNGQFQDQTPANFPDLFQGDSEFGDFDADGDLDLIILGKTDNGQTGTWLFENLGNFQFAEVQAGFDSLYNGSATWGDMDYDGDLDLLLTGDPGAGTFAKIYENVGNGQFEVLEVVSAPVKRSEASWVDYNKDGHLDFLLSGEGAGGTTVSRMYRNTGNKTFDLLPLTGLPNLINATMDWADYNADGYPDLLITGTDSAGNGVAHVLRNNGGTTQFTRLTTFLPQVKDGDARWGDLNGDKLPDIVISGAEGNSLVHRVFQNNGAGFVEKDIASLPLVPLHQVSLALGDFDGNGKLDLASLGNADLSNPDYQLFAYRNIDTVSNETPQPPTGLVSVIDADTVTLFWTPPVNAQGNSYELALGTASGLSDVSPAHADLTSGQRTIVRNGGLGQASSWKLHDLPSGTYFWRIQSVDSDYEGSPFSSEATFTYVAPKFVDANHLVIPSQNGFGIASGDADWVDYDNDSDLDLVILGERGLGNLSTRIYRNTQGVLQADLVSSTDIDSLKFSSMAWADFDQDNDADVLVMGEDGAGNKQTYLYRNTGTGRFVSDARGDVFPELSEGDAAWADYDNDGDLDVMITGLNGNGAFSGLYRQEESGFVMDTLFDFPAVSNSAVAWGDFDADGDQDLALTGKNGSLRIAKIYRNLGIFGGFEELNASAANINACSNGSLDWADFDLDGDLDLLLSGETGGLTAVSQVYEYQAQNGTFQQVFGTGLTGISFGEAVWADINDDSYPDIILAGRPGSAGRAVEVHLNDGAGNFEMDDATSLAMDPADTGARLALGDLDEDGKIDVALAGWMATTNRSLKVYLNRDLTPNQTADIPANLDAVPDADSVVLSWDPPAIMPAGVSYNVVIGTSLGGTQEITPLSVIAGPDAGYRKVVSSGNVGPRPSHRVMGLAAGTYFWTVQVIDADYEGSPFAPWQSFEYEPGNLTDVSTIWLDSAMTGVDLATLKLADIDRDGFLDMLVMGQAEDGSPLTQLLSNQGGRGFVSLPVAGGLANIHSGDAEWEDFDLDGDMDVVMVGTDPNGAFADVFLNQNGQFVAKSAGIESLLMGKVATADYDNDGDIDFLICGENAQSNAVTILYENDGQANFTATANSFTVLAQGDVIWGDFNQDGYQDLVLAGEAVDGTKSAWLYQNEGNGSFTWIDDAFPNDFNPISLSLDMADFNNDGWQDLIASGTADGAAPFTQIFQRLDQEAIEFEALALSSPLEEVEFGNVKWGDYNDDGYPDILLTGKDGAGLPQTAIYLNQQNGEFEADTLVGALAPVGTGSAAAWGDLDQDGKLDVALAGRTGVDASSKVLRVYRNDEISSNVRYGQPENLSYVLEGSTLRLEWEPPAGIDSVLAQGMTYNLFLGTAPDEANIIPIEASLSGTYSGRRYVAEAGAIGNRTQWEVQGLQEGLTYYWGVQLVDQDFEGSEFATASFDFTPPAFEDITQTAFSGSVPTSLEDGTAEFVDLDQDGDLDLVVTGKAGFAMYETKVLINDNGQLSESATWSAGLPGVGFSTVSFSDYDRDGDVDMFIAGIQGNSQGPISKLFENTGTEFVEDLVNDEVLVDIKNAASDWGDYDRDGDEDLLISGVTDQEEPVVLIYRNVDGVLEIDGQASTDFAQIAGGSVAFGDYDFFQSNGLDVAISGRDVNGTGFTGVYRNDGTGRFSLVQELGQVQGKVSWGDIQQDGQLDILVSGINAVTQEPVSSLFRYAGEDQFEPFMGIELENLSGGTACFADYNDNGFSDILITGMAQGSFEMEARLYRNLGAGAFELDLLSSRDLDSADISIAAFGDVDKDGKLDIFSPFARSLGAAGYSFVLFSNIDSTQNETPGVPQNLRVTVEGPEVSVKWDAPQGVQSTTFPFTYNIYIGTAGNPAAIVAPLSRQNGNRMVVSMGNAGHGNTWAISGIPDGQYVCAVQAVDADFEGGAFTSPITFDFVNPVPIITQEFFPEVYPDSLPAVVSSISILTDTAIQDVEVHFKGIAEGEWNSVSVGNSGLTYEFPVDLAKVDEMGLEYYFKVISIYGFTAQTDTHFTYRYHSAGLDVTGLGFGRKPSDYNIVSFPLQLESPNFVDVLEDDLGRYRKRKWRLFRYTDSLLVEYEDGLERADHGLGYWLITRNEAPYNTGPGLVVKSNDRETYTWNLRRGWNQMGNPYPFNIAWEDIRAANPGVADSVVDPWVQFDNFFNAARNVLDAYQGAFVMAHEDVALKIPVRKNPSIQRQASYTADPVFSGVLGSESWNLPIEVSQGGAASRLGGVGVHPAATDSRDPLDRMAPPRFADFVELSFDHPEYFHQRFAYDVRPVSDSLVWSFQVVSNSPSELLVLNWPADINTSYQKSLYLLDVVNSQLVNMEEVSEYVAFGTGGSHQFQIFYGDPAFIREHAMPSTVHVGIPWPNPANDLIHFPVSVPEGDMEVEVQVELFDLAGKMVEVATPQWVKPGYQTITWNLGDLQSGTPAPGVYLCKVNVLGASGIQSSVYRIILQ